MAAVCGPFERRVRPAARNRGRQMNFKIREVGNSQSHYADVVVSEGATKLDLGLLDAKQRRELAGELQSAIDDLLSGLPEES